MASPRLPQILRAYAKGVTCPPAKEIDQSAANIMEVAADEIERLRAEVAELRLAEREEMGRCSDE